ncbi:MAG: CvpA family protein [Patescibacteria group bacterium]|nr:CvpA family protein [Patescibacteria group bacterium]
MGSMPLETYDLAMLAVLVVAIGLGAWKGMAWQVASLASLFFSGVVAVRFSGPLAPLFSSSEPWNRFLAMFVLYLGMSLLIWVVFRMVSRAIDRVQLREFDRQAGALVGGLKGVALCLVITFFAVTLSEAARQAVLRSRSGYYIAKLIQRAEPVLPEEVRGVLGGYIEELDRRLDPATPPRPGPLDKLGEAGSGVDGGVVESVLEAAAERAGGAGTIGHGVDPWAANYTWPSGRSEAVEGSER